MKSLPIDTTALRFLVAAAPRPDLDYKTQQPNTDRDGQPKHLVDLLISREGRKSEVITVKVVGTSPAVGEGQRAKVTGLVGFLWDGRGDDGEVRFGISFSADKIEAIASNSKAAA